MNFICYSNDIWEKVKFRSNKYVITIYSLHYDEIFVNEIKYSLTIMGAAMLNLTHSNRVGRWLSELQLTEKSNNLNFFGSVKREKFGKRGWNQGQDDRIPVCLTSSSRILPLSLPQWNFPSNRRFLRKVDYCTICGWC